MFAVSAVGRLSWIVCIKQYVRRSVKEANFSRRCLTMHLNTKGRSLKPDTIHHSLMREQTFCLGFMLIFTSFTTAAVCSMVVMVDYPDMTLV